MTNNRPNLSVESLGMQARSAIRVRTHGLRLDGCLPTEPKPYIIRKVKNGHPYYYRAVMVRENGKRKQKILAYLGIRRPRGYKEPKQTIV